MSMRPTTGSFNSLQTGKRITSWTAAEDAQLLDLVSFNSLQTGTRITRFEDIVKKHFKIEFQFPSNGNADHKSNQFGIESGGRIRFQFPSNGKADHKGLPRLHGWRVGL